MRTIDLVLFINNGSINHKQQDPHQLNLCGNPTRGWFRGLIWVLVELWQVEGQPEVPSWLASRSKIFKVINNSGQIVSTFLSKYWWKYKKIRVLWQFFVIFTILMCSDSMFNFLKRVTDGSFLFLCKALVFLFLLFLNLGT